MKTLLDLTLQPVAKAIQPCRHFIQTTLGGFDRVHHRIVAATQVIIFVICLVFTSLFLTPATPAYAQRLDPQEVVEFALLLEKLEDDFYERAVDAFSSGLANLPSEAKAAVRSYGQDEDNHVKALSAVLTQLGGNPSSVTIPANPNYNAILKRNPFANPRDFLLALQYVEDVGVSAYKGQVQNLLAAGAAGKVILAGALEIHTVEARHAAGIRYLRQISGVNIRPWIRNKNEVIYNENRSNPIIPFSNVAFDGFSTAKEVKAIVGPILGQ